MYLKEIYKGKYCIWDLTEDYWVLVYVGANNIWGDLFDKIHWDEVPGWDWTTPTEEQTSWEVLTYAEAFLEML